MRVHAAAVLPEDRLRHERREQPELLRDVLHHEAERRDVVGGRQRVRIAEIDLVLPVRDLVVRRLHLEPHLLEHVDDRAPRVLAEIGRREIEVAADVVRRRRRLARRARLEQEELGLHPRVHHEAHLRRPRDLPLEHGARIAGKWRAVRQVDVADDARDAARFVAPRKDAERGQVGREQHVRLLDANEPFDRGAVEHDVARRAPSRTATPASPRSC